MAKGKKTGGRDFQPGVVTNPSGRPSLPEDVKQARALTKLTFEALANELIYLDKEELQAKMKDPKTTMIELMVCSIVAKGVQNGDHTRLNMLLDRLVGKVKDSVEVTGEMGFKVVVEDYLSKDEK